MLSNSYLNTTPGSLEFPQSNIDKAQAYPAASPMRAEVIQQTPDTSNISAPDDGPYSLYKGGAIVGDGDGQSDSIPAEIDGEQEARVADGEYAVPKDIAEKYGDKLKQMMEEVRKAAHPVSGKQTKQNAAKRAFVKVMSGISS